MGEIVGAIAGMIMCFFCGFAVGAFIARHEKE